MAANGHNLCKMWIGLLQLNRFFMHEKKEQNKSSLDQYSTLPFFDFTGCHECFLLFFTHELNRSTMVIEL